MANLIFICHRVPYPPNKGDKIRAWHMLDHLTRTHDVHLISWVDDPSDRQHAEFLARRCASVQLFSLGRQHRLYRAARAILSGKSITEGFYRDSKAMAHFDGLMEALPVDAIIGYSGGTAPYLKATKSYCRRLIDLVDVDSEKWRVLANKSDGIKRWIYAREARLTVSLEQAALQASDATLLVSEDEAALFASMSPARQVPKIKSMSNGVDSGYFDPEKVERASSAHPVIGFVGAMDYPPNIEAVTWFAQEILPLIQAEMPVVFQIIGTSPTRAVQKLENLDGVEVTGRVDDIRPYLAGSAAIVAPLKLARGIQNKVLEAMAMARPVVATTEAVTGIDGQDGKTYLVADTPDEFAHTVLDLLEDEVRAAGIGSEARRFVTANKSWAAQLSILDDCLKLTSAPSGEH